MYSVKNTDGVEIAVGERLTYMFLQDNGYFAPCKEPDAQGFCVDGVVYHLPGRPGFVHPEGIEVQTATFDEFNGPQRIVEEGTAAADEALAILRGEVSE